MARGISKGGDAAGSKQLFYSFVCVPEGAAVKQIESSQLTTATTGCDSQARYKPWFRILCYRLLLRVRVSGVASIET